MDIGAKNADCAFYLWWCRTVSLLSLLVCNGCASPGPPRPPSLNLPEPAAVFTAERVGDQVQLHWATPEKTTDGLEVHGPMTVVICRRLVVSQPKDCAAILRLPVVPGLSTAVDQLPSTLVVGTAVEVEYRLQLLNAGGHAAGESNAALIAGGLAPSAPQRLQAVASQEGAVLTWQGDHAQDAVELHRTRSFPAKPVKPSAGGTKNVDAADAILRALPGGGALDRTAQMGERYTYMAQRLRTITIEGHALEVRSALSAPVTLEMRDMFPPRQPSGLEAVAGDQVVDLSWRPNTESDLAGYMVMRQEAGAPTSLNTTLVLDSAFQDKTAIAGHTYRYTIVAVDHAGNRSLSSDSAQVSFRADVP